MIFYFSGTGNSKWIACQLSNLLQEKLFFIPNVLRDGTCEFVLQDEERIGFVFPVYSWAPPELVLYFIKLLSFRNYKSQYCFFVCSCGDDIGLTQQVFEKALGVKGWKCHAGFSVIMPNNYVLLPGFDVDDQVLEQMKLDEAVLVLNEIGGVLFKREAKFACKEGSMPFIKTKIINPLFNRFQMSPENFRVTENCIGCGCCEKICPMKNISMRAGKPVWGRICAACLACYHICPRQAVQYGKRTKGKGQYFNPNR